MKTLKINHRLILGLFVTLMFCLFIPQTVFCQTEKLGIVNYTPPQGWAKTPKENVIGFTEYNQATGKFCIITPTERRRELAARAGISTATGQTWSPEQ